MFIRGKFFSIIQKMFLKLVSSDLVKSLLVTCLRRLKYFVGRFSALTGNSVSLYRPIFHQWYKIRIKGIAFCSIFNNLLGKVTQDKC